MAVSADRRAETAAGARLHRVLAEGLQLPTLRLELWDGSVFGPPDGVTLRFRSRRGLDHLIGDHPERGFGRAYAEGEVEVEPLTPFLEAATELHSTRLLRLLPPLVNAAWALGARPDLHRTAVEAHLRGLRHTRDRDRSAVRHHYDLPAEFYALWLDPTMTYSCAYFRSPAQSLAEAQIEKLDLVCRKLRLRPGERLLDIGSGWGSLVLRAAERWGVHAVGVTTSPAQAERARAAVAEQGLGGRVEIRLADYRELRGESFDAVASVGMVEHVGRRHMAEYCGLIHRLLRPGGRALVHGITTRPGESGIDPFISAFVFPDGQLQEVGSMVTHLQEAGLEVRDVESLREHYALTLSRWRDAFEAHRDDAAALAGEERTRIWRLYLAACEVSFRLGGTSVHQILTVRPDRGRSGLPLRREDWYTGPPA